ncbi:tryptophan synthase beta subunit-like PLP-dependent enzyme [Amylocystis lapponica]|nr:tryptophan synthase beta subunit-like PLP-dependent enzyme [Amylocystis lapponica]
MSIADADPTKLWSETPLIYSTHLSSRLACDVYLKLETLHPSQSYKFRGMSYFIQHALRTRGPAVRLVIASSGNAGLATACAAKALHLRCTVFLPAGASRGTLDFLRREGAQIVEDGRLYLDARHNAEAAVQADANAVMVPAYDDPLLWEGHGSMVPEIARQLPAGTRPAAIFCSAGGGGLSAGIMHGCKAVGWDDVPFVVLETHGSNCLYESLALNPGPFAAAPAAPRAGIRAAHDAAHDVTVAHLAEITSRATSLGASSPAAGVVKMALGRAGGVQSVSVPDELAMQAALGFAEDHKIIVELACSTTLTPAYKPALFDRLVPPGAPRTVVFVVCGGYNVSLAELAEYQAVLAEDLQSGGQWAVRCNGVEWGVDK